MTDNDQLLTTTATRRNVLKGIGAAGTATAFGAASSGTVAAQDGGGLVDGLKEAVTGMAVMATTGPVGTAVYFGVVDVPTFHDDMETDPAVNRLELHEIVHNEIEWMDSHFVTFGNRMEDSRPIASLEARHGIATVWEDGGGAPESLDRAHARIDQYYALPEFNHLQIGSKALLQLSYVAGSGADTDPVYDLTDLAIHPSDGQNLQIRITDERQEIDFTLVDGTVVDETAFDNIDHIEGAEGKITMPVLEFVDPSTDNNDVVHSQPITQDVLETWDPDNEEVTFTIDGTDYTTSLRFASAPAGDASEDPSLASQRAFDGLEWIRQWQELRDLAQTVKDQYSTTFVENIHYELENGNITPEQVRSPEGMARFLSGTDDPTNDRFRISAYQQLGMASPDLSLVSEVEATWTGATGYWVDSDPNLTERHVYPDEFVENQGYTGMLFSETGDLSAGESYAVGYPLISAEGSTVYAQDARTGEVTKSFDSITSNSISSMTLINAGRTVVVGAGGEVVAHNIVTDEEEWRYTGMSDCQKVVANDELVFAGDHTDYNLHALDPQTGEHQWTADLSGSYLDWLSAGPNAVYTGDGVGNLKRIGLDGSIEWENGSVFSEIWTVDIDERHDVLYASGASSTSRFDLETGEEIEQFTSNQLNAMAFPKGDENIAYGVAFDGPIMKFDLSDDSVVWQTTPDSDTFYGSSLPLGPGEDILYAGHSNMQGAVDAETGEILYYDQSRAADGLAIYQPDEALSRHIPRAMMYAENEDETGESIGEVDMWFGELTIEAMRDADGAQITHVDDETIADIEALEATPDSIDTIVEEMDEFDSVEAIEYTRDVLEIVDHYGADATVGEDDTSDVRVTEPDYSSPDYDSYDASEFAEEMAALEEKIDQLEAEDGGSGGIGIGLPNFGESGGMIGVLIAAAGAVLLLGDSN